MDADRGGTGGQQVKTIRALRQARGWSQYELALRVGVHPQAVYLWETGRRTPQVPQMRKLGDLFEMCSDEIDLDAQTEERTRQRTIEPKRSAASSADPDERA
jgi:transcriptional regulator with XRE-family HTH domain